MVDLFRAFCIQKPIFQSGLMMLCRSKGHHRNPTGCISKAAPAYGRSGTRLVKRTLLWYSYLINRIIEETGKPFGDDAHIIYVNSQIKAETASGKLMHDFTCTDPDDMNYSVLAQRVRYFKEDTKGVTTMCKAMEEMRAKERKEATYAKAIAVAQKMLKAGIPYEEIADMVELSVDEVKALDTKKPA